MSEPSLVPAGNRWPIVLGIDPGTQVAGYGAVVVAPDGPRLLVCGVFRAPSRGSVPERLAHMLREFQALCERCQPDVLAIESAFAALNVRSALRIGEGRGVFLACAAARGIRVVEYAPATVKKAMVGNGQAAKEQVARMVQAQLGQGELEQQPLDATDALALALTHVQRISLERALARGRGR